MDHQLINKQDGHEKTQLHYYILNNRSHDDLTLLLQQNANPNIGDNDGRTPLHHAVMDCKTAQRSQEKSEQEAKDIVKLLIENKADLHKQDNYGNSPLETAFLLELDDLYHYLKKHIRN